MHTQKLGWSPVLLTLNEQLQKNITKSISPSFIIRWHDIDIIAFRQRVMRATDGKYKWLYDHCFPSAPSMMTRSTLLVIYTVSPFYSFAQHRRSIMSLIDSLTMKLSDTGERRAFLTS